MVSKSRFVAGCRFRNSRAGESKTWGVFEDEAHASNNSAVRNLSPGTRKLARMEIYKSFPDGAALEPKTQYCNSGSEIDVKEGEMLR